MNADLVRELFLYDNETGVFRWRIRPTMKRHAGDVAGSSCWPGRWRITHEGRTYFAHRLAWLYVYGSWPTQNIDHIDGDPLNNRISNLRDVSQSINAQNLKRAVRTNSTGLLGVSLRRSKYRAQITANGKTLQLGYFNTPEEAHAAYLNAKRELHPHAYA